MSAIVFSLLALSLTYADTEANASAEANVTTSAHVGGLIWKARLWLERAEIALTLDKEKQAEKAIMKAEARLKDVQIALANSDEKAAAAAEAAHARMLARIREREAELESSIELKDKTEREKLRIVLQKHQTEADEIVERLQVKVRGNISAEERARINALIDTVETNANFRIDVKIDGEQMKIRQRTEINTSVNETEFTKVNIEIHKDFSVAQVQAFHNHTKTNAVFKLNTTNETEIVQRIAVQTGLTEADIRANMKVHVSNDNEGSGSSTSARSSTSIRNGRVESETEIEIG